MNDNGLKAEKKTYVVEDGDTLFKVALKFDISILSIKLDNPGVSVLKPGQVLNITIQEEDQTVHPIISQIYGEKLAIDGTLFLENSSVVFKPARTKENKHHRKDTVIDLLGYVDSNLVPHPIELFDDIDEMLPDDCLALLQLTYLSIPDDPTSVEVIQFAGYLQELRNFKKAMEVKAGKFQKKNNYTRPLLSTFIKPAEKSQSKRRISTFSLETIDGPDPSTILTIEQIQSIRDSLPLRFRRSKWEKLFDINKDGTSFTTFSSRMKGHEHCILIIKTKDGDIFGAFSAAGFTPDKSFYANGETYVFTFFPQFAKYKWSKTTQYFVITTPEELSIGGGGGAAIWLDDRFLNGFSEKCDAFCSPPLASNIDFSVAGLEVFFIR